MEYEDIMENSDRRLVEEFIESSEYQEIISDVRKETKIMERRLDWASRGIVLGYFAFLGGNLASSAVFDNALTGPPSQRVYYQDIQDKVNLVGRISEDVGLNLFTVSAGFGLGNVRKRK